MHTGNRSLSGRDREEGPGRYEGSSEGHDGGVGFSVTHSPPLREKERSPVREGT